jgi:hypothetical protein
MNDSLETNWIIHLIDEELIKRKDIIKDEHIKTLSTSFILNRLYPYIACFSKNGDSLSQWRAYANDGKGIAIGIDEKKLGLEQRIPGNTFIKDDAIGYYNCIYDEASQREFINDNLGELCLLINKNMFSEINIVNIAISFNKMSVIFKNPSFFEEDEVRIIHIPRIMGDKENNTILDSNISEINFMVKGNSISSYFEFNLNSVFNSKTIPEIILGPKNNINIIELGTYLSINGLKETIMKKSISSYR